MVGGRGAGGRANSFPLVVVSEFRCSYNTCKITWSLRSAISKKVYISPFAPGGEGKGDNTLEA